MHTVSIDHLDYKIERNRHIQCFCINLFEIAVPSNMHILDGQEYTGDIVIEKVKRSKNWLYRSSLCFYISAGEFEKYYYLKDGSSKFKVLINNITHEYNLNETIIRLPMGLFDLPELKEDEQCPIRIRLENKNVL